MDDVHLTPGMPVTLLDRRGFATVVSAQGDQSKVSPIHPIENLAAEGFQQSKLDRVLTEPVSCGHVIFMNGWRIGRAKDLELVRYAFIHNHVRSPNGDAVDLAKGHRRVQVYETRSDPFELLARSEGETQYQCERLGGGACL